MRVTCRRMGSLQAITLLKKMLLAYLQLLNVIDSQGRVRSAVPNELPLCPSWWAKSWVSYHRYWEFRKMVMPYTWRTASHVPPRPLDLTLSLLHLRYFLRLRGRDADVLFRAEHSVDTYSQNFDKSWDSLVITIYSRKPCPTKVPSSSNLQV